MNPPAEGPWLLGVRFLAAGSFLTFERGHYLTAAGGYVIREVVRHPGAVVVVPMIGGRVVMIRQQRVAVGRQLLELPAGKVEPGETLQDTARRECEEEIGFRPGQLTPLHTFFSSPGFSNERIWLFLAEDLDEVPQRPHGFEEENSEIVELALGEALHAAQRAEIEDAKSLVGLYAVAHREGVTR